MTDTASKPSQGGAKQRNGNLDRHENPALRSDERQAVKNQSSVKPEDYPDRDQSPV